MGQAIGQALSYGVGAALSPIPIIAVVVGVHPIGDAITALAA